MNKENAVRVCTQGFGIVLHDSVGVRVIEVSA